MKSKGLTRREIATFAAGSALAVTAAAQTTPDNAATDLLKAARDANLRNGQTLGKLEIPLATEPAFQFKS